MVLICGAGEDPWESPGQQEIKPVNPKGNQPWIFIGSTDAEAPILWPPHTKSRLIGKDPGKIEGRRRRGRQRTRCLDGITDSMDLGFRKLWEIVKDTESWLATAHEVAKSRTRLNDWTELNWTNWQILEIAYQLSMVYKIAFMVVKYLSCVWFFMTSWTAAHHTPLSFTVSWKLLKLMSI